MQHSEDVEKITIPLKNKQVVLYLTQYEEIDVDDITKIQYHNIMGEILTCSVVLNRIGNMKAEVDEIHSRAKLDFEIFTAQEEERLRKDLIKEVFDSKGQPKIKHPTNPEVETAIRRTQNYRIKYSNVIDAKKQADIIDKLYWAVHSKNGKLDKLSEKLRPEDFERELVEGVVNGIMIKTVEKMIK